MNSSNRESAQQQRHLNESKNITTILPPEITSTPFVSHKTKVPSPLVTPTRKFSGPRRYALSNNGMMNPVKAIKDPPGPLLASTGYNVNVSTYIDTKSPGYAGRLVQYNEESSRKQHNTHQERYGSPGLFPIVHLFKKDVPVISPKMKRGTVRIGTPESRGYYSQEHSRLLLEGIVRSNSILKEQNNTNDVSTRSVLDALKEISRKRIHVSEDYDSMDDNSKKFRKSNGEGDYSKRNRVESPTSENATSPTTTQAKKKLCTIDAVLASKTSSMYANYEPSTKRKSSDDSISKALPTNKKKFTNVETQTPGTPVIVREMKRASITRKNSEEKLEKPVEKQEFPEMITSPKPVLKVLDDKPLEVIRKNRLGALLSALSGREIPSIPMEDRRKALDQEWPSQSAEKPLVSILSPQNKASKSADKHVTFDLPKSAESIPMKLFEKSSNEKMSDTGLTQNGNFSVMTSLNKTAEEGISASNTQPDNKEPTIASAKLDAPETKTEEKKVVGGFKFDLNKPIDPKTSLTSLQGEEDKTNVEKTNTSSSSMFIPMFGTPKSDVGALTSKSTLDTSSNKSPSTVNSLGLPTSLPSPKSDTFNFGTKPTIATTPVSINSNLKESSAFTFGKKEDNAKSPMTSKPAVTPTFGKIETSTTNSTPFGSKPVASPSFAFMGTSNVSTTFSATSNNTITCSASTTNVSSIPSFTSNTNSTISSASATNGFAPKAFDTVASSASTNTLGISKNSPGGFKFNSGNSLPAFGTPNSVSTTSTSKTFGSSNIATSSSNTLIEGSNKAANPFGSPATSLSSSSMFGANASPNKPSSEAPKPFAFGADKNSTNSGFTFNANGITSSTSTASTSNIQLTKPASTTSTNMFGPGTNSQFGIPTPASTSSFTFGAPNAVSSSNPSSNSSSMFNTTNTVSFGNANTPFGNTNTSNTTSNSTFGTATAPTFGAPSAPTFGTPSAPAFGTTNTPSFGTTSTSGFGTTTSTSFGTTSAPSFGTTSAPAFGTTSAPAFGTTSTPAFGTTSANSFGTTSASTFGTPNTSGFGSGSAPNFGSSNNFGNTNTPSFGNANTSGFGSTNTPNFGSSSVPNFGTNSTGAFGTINTPSFSTSGTSFNSTSTAAFGSISSSSFGTSNPTNLTTTKGNMFGNNTSGFAATNTAVTGTNSAFGGTSTGVSAFGTPSSSVFGSSNTPAFGSATTTSFASPSTMNAPSFGTPTSPFGSAQTSNANTFNSNNTSSTFGNSAGNAFGNFNSSTSQFPSVTTAPAFGTSTNNTFGNSSAPNAFGSSSSNTFGSPVPANPFGSNVNPTNSFGSTFGKKPEQSSSVFPASTNNMFNSNSAFGSNQSNNNGGTAGSSTSGVFTFGSSNSTAPASAGVFTFGASEPPKTFNFTAGGASGNTAAPAGNSFNSGTPFGQPSTAVPNMFSIGSGNAPSSSQARGRPLARARRRT